MTNKSYRVTNVSKEEVDLAKTLEDKIREISSNNYELNELNNELDKEIGEAEVIAKDIKEAKNKNKKDILKQLLSMALCISIVVSGHFLGRATIKKLTSDSGVCEVTAETFEIGKEPIVKTYEAKYPGESHKVKIVIRPPWNGYGERENICYDASDLKFDTAIKYFEYDLKKLEDKKFFESERLTEESQYKNFNDEVKNVIFYNYDIEKMHNQSYYNNMGLFCTIYYLLLVIILLYNSVVELQNIFDLYSPIYNIRISIDEIIYINKNNLPVLKEKIKYLKELIRNMLSEIDKNDELRNNFIKLYNENKYLMNDPELLFERYKKVVEEIDTQELRKKLK